MIPTRILVVLITLCSVFIAQAQEPAWGGSPSGKSNAIRNLSLEAGLGLRMYFGDIQGTGSLFNPPKFTYGIGVRYQLSPRLGVAIQGEGRKYKGKQEHGGFPDALDEMNGQLWGGHFVVQYSWLRWEDFTVRHFTERDPVTKANAFIGSGFGGCLFSSSYTSRVYKPQFLTDSLGQDSTVLFPVDASGSAAGVGLYVPVVLGFRYRIRPNISLGFEIQRHFYITKNVDALSSKKYDGMGTFTLRASYTFGQKKRIGSARKITKKGKYK